MTAYGHGAPWNISHHALRAPKAARDCQAQLGVQGSPDWLAASGDHAPALGTPGLVAPHTML